MRGPRRQDQYDHRLRQLVHDTQNIGVALSVGVPRSTANGWSPPDVISAVVTGVDEYSSRNLPVSLGFSSARFRAL